ncbi:hypothetical protein E2562_012074 [Oryza meyeriana var. granulata]|uniref:Uncharacterized protein n=1 Tax=Oryza meyeriana var. granulata TaxID=110450 RepID=A0A6G1F764_9ORYZ|nr:hypothetical protein E2562_012074 [Oryza meyeriana var. granulata]
MAFDKVLRFACDGLRFPCCNLLPAVLTRFKLELLQLSPSGFMHRPCNPLTALSARGVSPKAASPTEDLGLYGSGNESGMVQAE